MQRTIPDEDKPRVVGHLPPFVEIKSDGVRALDSGQTRRNIRREHGESSVSGIDVEPHLFSLSDAGDGSKIIDSADIDRAGGRGYEEGRQARTLILGYGFFECQDIDLVLPVHRDDA